MTHRICFAIAALMTAGAVALSGTDEGTYCRDASASLEKKASIGVLPGGPLARLGLTAADFASPCAERSVFFLGKSKYLNGARAVVTHSIDDTTKYVPQTLDIMDKYGIKATIFVTTATKDERGDIDQLWPRLRMAIANGHEIGAHSRHHRCKWPDSPAFCAQAFSDDEVLGARDDILRNTPQQYVWAWAYPCGNCGECTVAQEKVAEAGYLVARTYPGEEQNQHLAPGLETWAPNVYSAAYTQVVQKQGGIAKSGRTNLAVLNAKFDEVYRRGDIYSFVSHPQWLDLGRDGFYEKHLAHIGRRSDVWYVPLGPLYAYRTVVEATEVRELKPDGALARFAVFNTLDPKVFMNSVTLEFRAPKNIAIVGRRKAVPEREMRPTDHWDGCYFRRYRDKLLITVQPNTVLEFRLKRGQKSATR